MKYRDGRWARLVLLAAVVMLAHALVLQALSPTAPALRPDRLAFTLTAVPDTAPAMPALQEAPQPPPAMRPSRAPPRPASTGARSDGPAPAGVDGLGDGSVSPVAAAREDTPDASASASAGPAPVPIELPSAMSWRYRVQSTGAGEPVTGEAHLHWRPDGGRYEAQWQVMLAGALPRVQRSEGLIVSGGLVPLRFSERMRHEEATHFQQESGRIVFSANRPAVPMPAGTHDRLSVLVQLAAWRASRPADFTPGREWTLHVAGTRDAGDWRFTVTGVGALDLPDRTVEATHLTREPRHPYDSRLELWLGPAPDYGPVRLRLTYPDGNCLDLQWFGTDRP